MEMEKDVNQEMDTKEAQKMEDTSNQEIENGEKKETENTVDQKAVFSHKDEEITINLGSLKKKTSHYKNKTLEKASVVLSPMKKFVLARRRLLTVAAVIAVVCIIALSFYTANSGYRGVLKEVVRIVNHREADPDVLAQRALPKSMAECYNNIVSVIGDINRVDYALDNFAEDVDDQYARLDDQFGSNAKVSVKVIGKEKMSQSQLRKAQKSYQDYYEEYLQNFVETIDEYDYEKINSLAKSYDLTSSDLTTVRDAIDVLGDYFANMDVNKGYILTVELKVRGSRDSYTTKEELRVIKANGEWTLDYMTISRAQTVLRRMGSGLDSILWFL